MGKAEDILKKYKQTSRTEALEKNEETNRAKKLLEDAKRNSSSYVQPKAASVATKPTISTPKVNPAVQKIVNDAKKPLPLPGQNTGKAATFTPLPVFKNNNANEFVHLSEKPMVNFDMNNTEKYGFKVDNNGKLRRAWESDEVNPRKYGFDVSATGKIVPVSENVPKRSSKEIELEIENWHREMATAKKQRTAQSIKRSTIGRMLDDNIQIADDGRAQADVDRRIAELNTKKKELDKELLTVKKAEYKALSNNYDFDKLSKPITDKSGLPREYKYINDIDGYRKKERDNANDSRSAGIFIYDRLSPEEVRTYNYIFATSGKEQADDYLESMRDELNARQGRMYASDYQNSNTAEKILHGATIGVGSGIENTLMGLKQVLSEEAVPTTANQYAASEIRPKMSKAGRFFFDAGELIGGQLPNIVAAPFIGGGAASTLLGLSAGGNAYKEKIEEGYSSEEARGYATVIGLLEGALQYAIGGITSMGRKPSSKSVTEMANAIRSAVLRLPVKLTISGGKEASEEMLQDFLVPVVETLMLGEEYEPAKLEDMLYTGLLAFATNGIFNAGDVVSDVTNHRAGKQIIKDGKTDALIDSGLKSGAESETYKLAEQLRNRQEKGKKISPYQLGELKRQTEFATAQEKASPEQGQTPRYEHYYNEGKVTPEFINAVDNDLLEYVERVEKNEENTPKAFIMGDSSKRINSDIKKLTGIDTTSYRHRIGKNSVKHIFKRHGKNGIHDRSMANNDDVARIEYVLNNYDNIELLNDSSMEYRDKNQQPAPKIKIKKKIDGTFYVVEAVPDTKAKNLEVVSAYIEKEPYQQTRDVQAPQSNVRNASADNDSDNSIPQSEEKSNSNSAAPKPKMGSNGQRGFAETYVGDTVKTVAPKDATAGYKAVYNSTIENRAMTEAEAQAAAKIPDTMVRAAEAAARADAVAETSPQVYNENTNEQEDMNDGREGVHLRGSSQRADGSHTQGQIPAVEEDTRRDSSGDVQTFTRTEGEDGAYAGEAPLTYGRKLTSAHIVGRDIGSRHDKGLRLVESGENADTRAARKVAEQRGLKLILFAGDNLHIKDQHGNEISARAYIRGKKMYIRADHPVYTAEQLAKHEAGHDRIDRGEIDVDAVRKKLAGRTDEASRLYIEAYTAESDMTEQEIWAEVICDSLAGMNIFAQTDSEGVADTFLGDVRQATSETSREAKQTSEQSESTGHTSRELDNLEFLRRENEDLKLKLHEARRQVKRTERPTARLGDAYRAAQKLKARYDVDMEKEDLGKKIHELANYVIQGEELTFDEIKRRARRIASEMVENAVVQNSTMYDEYKDLRDYVRDTKFAISEEDSHNIADFSAFKKSNFGRMPKLGIGQTNIDSVYREMQEQWPEFFSEEEIHHPADQLMHIVQVLDGLRITYDNPYSYNKAQAAEYIANDIVDTVLSEEIRQNKPTFADKQVARRAAIIQQVIEKERNKRREKEEKMRKEFTEREDKMKSRWGARDMMRSIERHANKLTSALLRPNDKNHIPEDLRGVVATALYALNRESVYETYLDPETNKRKKVKIGKAEWFTNETSPMKKTIEAQEKRKEIAELDARKRLLKKIMAEAGLESSAEEISFKDAVRKLKDVYSEMDKDAEKKQQVLIAPELLDMLAKLEELSDTPIGAMDKDQLGVVWEAIRMIEASIANADKMFSKGRFAEISKAAGQMRADNLGKHTPGNFLVEKTKTAMLNLLDAQRYLHMLGHAGDALFRGLEAAQGKHNLIKKEISEFARELTKDIDVRALEREKNTVILGHQERTISTAQLMELYILMKRPAARRHILKGGIKIDAIPGIKGEIAQHYKTIKVNKTEIEQAITQFIREHKDLKEIADKMQRFAADNLGAYGNEASLEVFGYKKFKDADYWPIRAEHWEDLEAKARQTKVSNMGHSKQLENSISELYIGSAFETFARHSEAQAMYAAYLGIEQDIERIKNFSFWEAVDGEESERVKTGTVKEIINKVHGPEGVNFIVKQMQDIQSMAAGEQDLFSKMTKGMIGKNKAAAIGTNIRVMAQQWTAYFRNASVMSPKYLAQVGNVKKGWEEAKKHAPIAWQKAIGYSTAKDLMFDTGGVLDTIAEWSMKGAAAVDAVQFGALWNACKAETKAKHKDLKYGSDEFYDVVVKRFTDIVNQTQVVDGVLQRPQIMRSQNALNQMASAFMSEPLKQFNMFTGAVYDVMHAQTKEQKTKAAKQLTRTTTALLVSGVINSMAQSLVDALRDDEEKEEKFMKRWIDAFIGFTGDEKGLSGNTKEFAKSNIGSMLNPLGYIPYAKDITSVAMGYDISRMDMDVVNKLWRAGMDLTTAISGEGKKTIESALINAIAEGARFFGISASNLRRDIKAIVMSVAIQTDNYLFQYGLEKSEKNMLHKQNGKVFLDILYNAYKNDKEAYEVIYKDLLNSGMESDTIRKGMESRQKKDEGVTKVDELKQQRYLAPEQEAQFNSKLKPVKQSSAWKKADSEQRKYAEGLLYEIVAMTRSYEDYKRVIEGGSGIGITEEEWLQYKLGLRVVDQKNDNGKLGTYTSEEKDAALDLIPGLKRKERDYLKNPSDYLKNKK